MTRARPAPSSRQGASNLHGTNQGGVQWPSTSGYRCLRFEIHHTVGVTVSADQYVTFDRIRIGTREALFPAVSGGVVDPLDTAALARDVIAPLNDSAASLGVYPILHERDSRPSSSSSRRRQLTVTDTDTSAYMWGLDPHDRHRHRAEQRHRHHRLHRAASGKAPPTSSPVSPRSTAATSASTCPTTVAAATTRPAAFSAGPTSAHSGSQRHHSSTTRRSATRTTNPDYTVQTQEGAQSRPRDGTAQPLIDYLYTNYQTHQRPAAKHHPAGREPIRTIAFAQGYRRVEDYTIQPSVGDNQTPMSQATQYLAQRRLAVSSATVNITNDGSTRLLHHETRLRHPTPRHHPTRQPPNHRLQHSRHHQRRLRHTRRMVGRIRRRPEQVELTLTQPPGQVSAQRTHGKLANRTLRNPTPHPLKEPTMAPHKRPSQPTTGHAAAHGATPSVGSGTPNASKEANRITGTTLRTGEQLGSEQQQQTSRS